MGEGDERYVIVTKNDVPAHTRPLRSQASTIGRAQRSLGIDAATASGFLGPGTAATTGRTGLRPKKSAPDMLRDRDGSTGFNSYGNLAARTSNSNLRDGYASTSGRRSQNNSSATGGAAGLQNLFASPYDATGEHAGQTSSPAHANLLRQPRGPPAPGSSDVRNFAVRSRIPTNGSTNSNTAGNTSPPPQVQINGSPTKNGFVERLRMIRWSFRLHSAEMSWGSLSLGNSIAYQKVTGEGHVSERTEVVVIDLDRI